MNRIALAKLASINFDLDLVGEYKFKSLASAARSEVTRI